MVHGSLSPSAEEVPGSVRLARGQADRAHFRTTPAFRGHMRRIPRRRQEETMPRRRIGRCSPVGPSVKCSRPGAAKVVLSGGGVTGSNQGSVSLHRAHPRLPQPRSRRSMRVAPSCKSSLAARSIQSRFGLRVLGHVLADSASAGGDRDGDGARPLDFVSVEPRRPRRRRDAPRRPHSPWPARPALTASKLSRARCRLRVPWHVK